jgi:hypothetical protein
VPCREACFDAATRSAQAAFLDFQSCAEAAGCSGYRACAAECPEQAAACGVAADG